jgi:hypothetical protein
LYFEVKILKAHHVWTTFWTINVTTWKAKTATTTTTRTRRTRTRITNNKNNKNNKHKNSNYNYSYILLRRCKRVTDGRNLLFPEIVIFAATCSGSTGFLLWSIMDRQIVLVCGSLWQGLKILISVIFLIRTNGIWVACKKACNMHTGTPKPSNN